MKLVSVIDVNVRIVGCDAKGPIEITVQWFSFLLTKLSFKRLLNVGHRQMSRNRLLPSKTKKLKIALRNKFKIYNPSGQCGHKNDCCAFLSLSLSLSLTQFIRILNCLVIASNIKCAHLITHIYFTI